MSSSLAEKFKNRKLKQQMAEPKAATPEARQVRLRLVYIDFMSALKMSFLLGVAQFVVVVVGSLLLYVVFVQTGIFETANSVAGEVLGSGSSFNVNDIVSIGRTVGAAAAIGFVNMIVITVMGAVAAFLFNVAAKIAGGISVGFTNEKQ